MTNIIKNIFLFLFFTILLNSIYFYEYAKAENREDAVVKAVRKVSPSVVNISSEYEVRKRNNPFAFGGDQFFDSFFKDFFDPGFEQKYKRSSLGSGVIIDGKRGFILTNAHVISKSSIITVIFNDERTFEANVIGSDADSDLAVLKIKSNKTLPAVDMGDSDDLMIGETVIAIGNPFGFSHTVTKGVISAINRNFRTEENVFQDFIQTDASINPGNSGGPLLNINGELIGINTAIYAKAQGIGFAIPINKAKKIISDLIRHGEVVYPWIGIAVQNSDDNGVMIKKIDYNSPAQKAGLKVGDIILTLKNKPISFSKDYDSLIKEYSAGDVIKLKILRDKKEKDYEIKTVAFPTNMAEDLAYELLGIKVKNLLYAKKLGYRLYSEEGVIISELLRKSYLSRIGAAPGDIIRQIDESKINDINDFEKAIIKCRHKDSIAILLQRGNQLYNITIKITAGI